MMTAHSVLTETALRSQLGAESILKPNESRWKRNLAADLLLTALIDAFSILVIFLLMNFSSTGEILFMSKNMELPKSSQSETLERNTIVKIEDGKLFLEGKEVAQTDLMAALLGLRKEWADTHKDQEFPGIITIQADRRAKYESLNSLVVAMAQSGFSDIRFAVLMK